MGWHRHDEDRRADYIRDLRKHEEWPDDPIMIRLPEPVVKEINPWQLVIPIMGWIWAGAFLLAVSLI